MIKILAIDGGGTRGIVPATILDCLEKEMNDSIINRFDVFAGTSTGGIISIALAAGLEAEEMVSLYLDKASKIFRQTFFDKLSGVDEYLEADYSNKNLKKILTGLFGEKTFGDLHTDANFGAKKKHLMICSFDLNPDASTGDNNKNYRPDVFYSGYMKDAGTKLVDAALMTSAGPTYFPIYNDHIDGGVAMNNPSMAAVAFSLNDQTAKEPKYLYPDGLKKGLSQTPQQIKVLSLGTGTGNKTFITSAEVKKGNWGKLKWVNYLPDLITESNMQSSLYYVQQVLPENNFIRLNPCFDDEGAPDILRNAKDIPMDERDAAKLQAMHEYAKTYFEANKTALLNFLQD